VPAFVILASMVTLLKCYS